MNEVLELALKLYELLKDEPWQIRDAAISISQNMIDGEDYVVGQRQLEQELEDYHKKVNIYEVVSAAAKDFRESHPENAS